MIKINQYTSSWLLILACAALGLPSFAMVIGDVHLDPILSAMIFGLGIVGGAFLISWAAEAAQVDISASFAIAILALIAILPEYAVEAVLAWEAGQSYVLASQGGQVFSAGAAVTDEMERVAANVTGANRLLIGLGWSAVILIFWIKRRMTLNLSGTMGLELIMLSLATTVTFLIFFMQQVHMIVGVALIAMYFVYLWISSTKEAEEPELMGPSLMIGEQSKILRRALVLGLFLYSAIVIIVAAEPFVHALVESGKGLGIDEFILIQWVAPLASESPEIIIAVLFSLRANPVAGLTTLVSAEVNQLTLLVGSMVGIFSLSAGELLSFPLNHMQSVEFLLTAAVSLFALILVVPRIIGWKSGSILLILFLAHLPFTGSADRLYFTYGYLLLSALIGVIYLYKWKMGSGFST
jgi:cation:H+ antiporter|tara:strand:+ start:1449 stop:2678 length:1230 start_codon:yes stop_codon:yes gene_type:complete